jgi:TolA-binding protein
VRRAIVSTIGTCALLLAAAPAPGQVVDKGCSPTLAHPCTESSGSSRAPRERSEPSRDREAERAAREEWERRRERDRHDQQVRKQALKLPGLARKGNYQEAKRLATELLNSDPYPELRTYLREYLAEVEYEIAFAAAYDALNRGDWAVAEAALRRGLVSYPGDADAHAALGQALEAQGRQADAILEYRSANMHANGSHASATTALSRLTAIESNRRLASEADARATMQNARLSALSELRIAVQSGKMALEANDPGDWLNKPLEQTKCRAAVWDNPRCGVSIGMAPLSPVPTPEGRMVDSSGAPRSSSAAPAGTEPAADGAAEAAVPRPPPVATPSTRPPVEQAARSKFDQLNAEAQRVKRQLFQARTPEESAAAASELKRLNTEKSKAHVEIVKARISVPLVDPKKKK